MMRPVIARLVLSVLISTGSIVAAQAGICSSQIAELRQAMPKQGAASAPPVASAPQTVGAQLDRQPTPSSVQQAKQNAQSDLDRVLAQAEEFDRQGNASACEARLGQARLMLNP